MITTLRLQHFRSYTDQRFRFGPGVNIIVGPNGSGKTNLLEAILVLARGSSYRVRDAELVQYEADWARLDADLDHGQRTVKLVAHPSPAKSYEIDGKALHRLHLSRMLPVVVFEPNHLLMLSAGPDLRRSYLDDLLEQLQADYAGLRKDYRRVLTQRNALLKRSGLAAEPQMFPWNLRLSQLGGDIARRRIALLKQMNQSSSELYGSLAHQPDATIGLQYETQLPHDSYDSALLKLLEDRFTQDVTRGYTSYGPHRDDMKVFINGHDALVSASRGEARTAVLMLKVMELGLLETTVGSRPLLLLDDVFSELDTSRRQALTHYLQPYQTFITTTDADAALTQLDRATMIELEKPF